jgi:hypothetical protein
MCLGRIGLEFSCGFGILRADLVWDPVQDETGAESDSRV